METRRFDRTASLADEILERSAGVDDGTVQEVLRQRAGSGHDELGPLPDRCTGRQYVTWIAAFRDEFPSDGSNLFIEPCAGRFEGFRILTARIDRLVMGAVAQ